jgi:hypothetical protein
MKGAFTSSVSFALLLGTADSAYIIQRGFR